MKTLIVLGLLTGLDNLQVSPGLGMLKMSTARRWLFALSFGLFEALMPLIGLFIGQRLHAISLPFVDKLGPTVMLVCGITIIVLVLREKDVSALVSSGWTLIGLPFSLSIDNLLAGIGVGANGYPLWLAAVVIGGTSTIICWLGLLLGKGIGQGVTRWFPRRIEAFGGAYLVLLGLGMLWNPFSL